jgi:hypothetical protein
MPVGHGVARSTVRGITAVDRLLPAWVRLLPVRLYERDVRGRIRDGRPIV